MTSDEFKELEEAFQNALAVDGAERDIFLDKLDQDRPDLAKRVRELLKADATGDTIADPIAASVKALKEDGEDPWIGKTIGDWRLDKRIGAGGMGAVFLADRADEQYAQTAALKIMGAQLLDQNAAARFRAERQILANLNHPNIATLIDGGSTDDGLPYLVMEYVDGVRIDDYCDNNNLAISDRLSLFQKLCAAVDYAHRSLVVHRDLKPSNMLVAENGDPKLLDFGIAKLLEAGDDEFTMAQTGEGARVMTPEYASPEQVRGEPVSVATDVYALGVLLFRLLTGHSPYGPSVTTPREIESAILEADPKKPSASITEYSSADDKTPSADDLSEKRSVSPEHLRKTLSGDLDTIILKCLQKEPERRYATARELAADIDRYLDNRPIHARADSWSYKAKKFVTRNSRYVAAVAAMFIAIVSLVTFYTLRLADERDKAQLAASEAEQVSGFLSDVFRNAAPRVAQGREVTAIDLVDQAVEQINDLSGQPILQGNLLAVIGSTLNGLGEYERSTGLLQRAVGVLEPQLTTHPEEFVYALGRLAEAQRNLGAFDLSLQNRRRALSIAEAQKSTDKYKLAGIRNSLGATLVDAGECGEALEEFDRSIEILTNAPDEFASLRLSALVIKGVCLDTLGRYAEAEEINRVILPEQEEVDGALHPNTISQYSNFALVLARQWKLEESIENFRIAVERGETVWPEGNQFLTTHKHYLSIMLGRQGYFDEAEDLQEQVAATTLKSDGPESVSYAVQLYGLGALNAAKGDLASAELYYRQSAELAMRVYGDAGAYTVMSRIYLGRTLFELGKTDEAERSLNQALAHIERVGFDHQTNLKLVRARLYSRTDRFADARLLLQEVMSDRAETPEMDPSWVQILTQMGAAYLDLANQEQAISITRRAHQIGETALPTGNWIAALATAEYAYALAASGETTEAKRFATDAYADLTVTFDPGDYRIIPLKELIDSE